MREKPFDSALGLSLPFSAHVRLRSEHAVLKLQFNRHTKGSDTKAIDTDGVRVFTSAENELVED